MTLCCLGMFTPGLDHEDAGRPGKDYSRESMIGLLRLLIGIVQGIANGIQSFRLLRVSAVNREGEVGDRFTPTARSARIRSSWFISVPARAAEWNVGLASCGAFQGRGSLENQSYHRSPIEGRTLQILSHMDTAWTGVPGRWGGVRDISCKADSRLDPSGRVDRETYQLFLA